MDRQTFHFDSTHSFLSSFEHHPPSFYFRAPRVCASVARTLERSIKGRRVGRVRTLFPSVSPSFLQFLHFLRANFDPGLGTTPSLFLLFSFLLPLAPAHCPSASRLHRNTVTYPHGNRYPARGYRTLISSRASRSHIPGFVGTVHRTVSFGYSKRSESGFSRK